MGYTGNENRKLKFGLIFLDFRPYTIAHHSDIALSHVSILGPTGPARIVRGRLFRGVTVYIADLQMSDLGKSEHNSIHQKISTSYIYRQ